MNRHPRFFGADEHDDLENVPCSIGAQDEPSVGVLAGIFDCERMVCGMSNVFVSHTVLAR